MIVAIIKEKDGGILNYHGGNGDGEKQRVLRDINKKSQQITHNSIEYECREVVDLVQV